MRSSDLDGHRLPDATPSGATLASAEARALAAALGTSDPLRAGFADAVRGFVRAERRHGHELEGILAALGRLVQVHAAPGLGAGRHRELRDTARWFAVSEFHRGD